MVVAGAAPLTVVAGVLPLILLVGNGIGAPVNYVIAGAVLLLFSVGFTTMSKHISNAGAFGRAASSIRSRGASQAERRGRIYAVGIRRVDCYAAHVHAQEATLGPVNAAID